MKRRDFLRAAAWGVGAVALAACSPKPPATEKPAEETALPKAEATSVPAPKKGAKLLMWMPQLDAWKMVLDRMIARHRAKYPEDEVTLEVFPWSAWGQKVGAELSSGTGPDLFQTHGASVIRDMQSKGVILPIPETVMATQYIESNWTKGALATARWRGEYSFLPQEIVGWQWCVHESLMKQAGVAALPTSYEQHLDLMKKATIRDGSGLVQAGTAMMNWTYSWFCVNYLSAGGDKVWDVQPDKQIAAFNNDLGVASLKSITDLVTEHKFWEPGFPEARPAFQDRKVCTILDTGWSTGFVRTEHAEWPVSTYTFATGLPSVGSGGPRMFAWPGFGWVVGKQGKQIDAAWRLWRGVYDNESLIDQALTVGEGCANPVVEAEVTKQLPEKRPDLMVAYADTAKYGTYEPVWDMQTVEKEINGARDRVLLQGASVKEALDTAVKNIDTAIAKAFVAE